MVALHYSDLQALLPELQSLLKQRLQKIKALPSNSGTQALYPLVFSFERQHLLLDLKQSQLFLIAADFSATSAPVSSPSLSKASDTAESSLTTPPPAWVMLCRKHLQGHRLISLELLPHDRILKVVWASGAQIVIELSGRHANAFVLAADGHLLGAWRTDASQRALRPGMLYQFPKAIDLTDFVSELSCLPADGSRSAALALNYQSEHTRQQQSELLQVALRQARKAAKREQSLLQRLEQDLNQLDQVSHWQQTADLLQAVSAKNRRGQSEAEVLDYYAAEPGQRKIQLDPRYTVAEQIAKLYHRAQKAERAAERALTLWDQQSASHHTAQRRLSELEAFWHKHDRGDSLTSDEIQVCLSGLKPTGRVRQSSPKAVDSSEAIRQFRSLTGLPILVGKSDKGNQRLSLQIAKGNDYWFHLQDLPGSHVVLRTGGRPPEQQDLLDAATLAVHYSKLRDQPKVAVSYTQVKNLKGLKGGRPGQVLLKAYKTLLLSTESERLERLKNSRIP